MNTLSDDGDDIDFIVFFFLFFSFFLDEKWRAATSSFLPRRREAGLLTHRVVDFSEFHLAIPTPSDLVIRDPS